MPPPLTVIGFARISSPICGTASALSLRELADAVGIRASSLYTYFGSKEAIFDAMFAQGWTALGERAKKLESAPPQNEPFKAEARGSSRSVRRIRLVTS